MSTYWHLKCISHDPVISSDEITQHTDYRLDLVRKMWAGRRDICQAIELIGNLELGTMGLEVAPEFADYMTSIALRFILDHINCNIHFCSEYGDIQLIDLDETFVDQAVLIESASVEPGGAFFMNDQAVVGWYCVRSTDPQKQDLFLPLHIFRKCFRFLNNVEYKRYEFGPVKEIV